MAFFQSVQCGWSNHNRAKKIIRSGGFRVVQKYCERCGEKLVYSVYEDSQRSPIAHGRGGVPKEYVDTETVEYVLDTGDGIPVE